MASDVISFRGSWRYAASLCSVRPLCHMASRRLTSPTPLDYIVGIRTGLVCKWYQLFRSLRFADRVLFGSYSLFSPVMLPCLQFGFIALGSACPQLTRCSDQAPLSTVWCVAVWGAVQVKPPSQVAMLEPALGDARMSFGG